MVRHCFECGAEITMCMGFVVAGDMLLFYEGIIIAGQIRERCGMCVEQDAFKRYPEEFAAFQEWIKHRAHAA